MKKRPTTILPRDDTTHGHDRLARKLNIKGLNPRQLVMMEQDRGVSMFEFGKFPSSLCLKWDDDYFDIMYMVHYTLPPRALR